MSSKIVYHAVHNKGRGKIALGRPRSFKIEEALESALRVFWEKGYEGASLPELTEAMGINRPSLYAAFGNKKGLFLKVLDHYRETSASYLVEALMRPTAREVFEALLKGAIDLQAGGRNPVGCLFVHGALVCTEDSTSVKRELALRRIAGEIAIRERFEKAVEDGDLPKSEDPANLAKFAATLLHGLAVQAVNGDSVPDLDRVAELALRSFPKVQKPKNSPT